MRVFITVPSVHGRRRSILMQLPYERPQLFDGFAACTAIAIAAQTVRILDTRLSDFSFAYTVAIAGSCCPIASSCRVGIVLEHWNGNTRADISHDIAGHARFRAGRIAAKVVHAKARCATGGIHAGYARIGALTSPITHAIGAFVRGIRKVKNGPTNAIPCPGLGFATCFAGSVTRIFAANPVDTKTAPTTIIGRTSRTIQRQAYATVIAIAFATIRSRWLIRMDGHACDASIVRAVIAVTCGGAAGTTVVGVGCKIRTEAIRGAASTFPI